MPETEQKFAVIGGTGFDEYQEIATDPAQDTSATLSEGMETPYGLSAPVISGHIDSVSLLFMPRHGKGHVVPPHRINYRANIWALKQLGVTHVLAINAVGGIHEELPPGRLMIPDQIIDYTWGREHSFFDGDAISVGDFRGVEHIDFTTPYDQLLRHSIESAARQLHIDCFVGGVYGCMQGPRLETAAEIKKLQRDGCDAVGMTSMPEAALARELGLHYASLGVVVNWAAGLSDEPITLPAIYQQLQSSMVEVKAIIGRLSQNFAD